MMDMKLAFSLKVTLKNPVLTEGDLASLATGVYLKSATLPTFFDISDGVDGALERALEKLCTAADAAVRSGCQLLILTDRTDSLVTL